MAKVIHKISLSLLELLLLILLILLILLLLLSILISNFFISLLLLTLLLILSLLLVCENSNISIISFPTVTIIFPLSKISLGLILASQTVYP